MSREMCHNFCYFKLEDGLHIHLHGESEQFTGLLDQNAKEIYEGDIVNIGKYGVYVVVFDEFWCGFEFKGGKGVKTKSGVEHPRFSQDWQTAEVIGNIHENPELVVKNEK